MENAVEWALKAGYRHIDAAAVYGNEAEVGRAIKAAGLPREKIFVSMKIIRGREKTSFTNKLYRSHQSCGTLITNQKMWKPPLIRHSRIYKQITSIFTWYIKLHNFSIAICNNLSADALACRIFLL